jgi:hypothetical protein
VIQKIVSGGQTGVDRAALDWALAHHIPHGGWCPAGRRAEDGVIPDCYVLQETPGQNYQQRTKRNVRDSDGTLIITATKELTGGSLFTQEYANKINRPCLHVYPCKEWHERVNAFLKSNPIRVLNVAGPRNSGAPGIERFVCEVLDEAYQVHIMDETLSD